MKIVTGQYHVFHQQTTEIAHFHELAAHLSKRLDARSLARPDLAKQADNELSHIYRGLLRLRRLVQCAAIITPQHVKNLTVEKLLESVVEKTRQSQQALRRAAIELAGGGDEYSMLRLVRTNLHSLALALGRLAEQMGEMQWRAPLILITAPPRTPSPT